MSLFPPTIDNAEYFSMYDEEFACSRIASKPFSLEDVEWPTVEHYYQAMRFENASYREQIRLAESPEIAVKLGKTLFKKKRSDWKKVETTIMTRALFTQCQIYPEMQEKLLATEDAVLVENSQYDYFWGCGRDRRGENHYGKVLMGIRAKLNEMNEKES